MSMVPVRPCLPTPCHDEATEGRSCMLQGPQPPKLAKLWCPPSLRPSHPSHNTPNLSYVWMGMKRLSTFSNVNCIKRSWWAGWISAQISTCRPHSPYVIIDICLLWNALALVGARSAAKHLHRHSHTRLACPSPSCCSCYWWMYDVCPLMCSAFKKKIRGVA